MSLSDAELEKMATEIVHNFCESIGFLKGQYLTDKGIILVKSALCKVRDSVSPQFVMPSSADMLNEAQKQFMEMAKLEVIKENQKHILLGGFIRCYDWLKSQLKPVQPLSDEIIKKYLDSKIDDKSFTKHGGLCEQVYRDAFKYAAKWAHARILGGTK